MNIAALFVRRPVMTALVMIGILAFGAVGYRLLPVNALPNVDFPTIQVQASLPGASPDTMASAVATPLEKQFTTIAGIDSMTSVSTNGTTTITIQFSLDRNIDAAAQDVQSAIAAAARQLPSTLPTPPTQRKVNPADASIILLALTSETQPLSSVDEYAENNLAQRISTINGVAQVQVFGSQKYAVRVQLDPNALATRGIALTDVEQAIGNANVNLPTGTLYGRDRATSVMATGQLIDAKSYAPMIVTYRNGAPVRLAEIGRVFDSVQNDKVAAWYNGTRGVVLAVQRQPGTNTIEVVDAIRAVLPSFQAQLPPSINLSILYDRSQSIRDSVRDVQLTLLVALFLVVAVIFVFLRSASATIIPSLALPLSIVGTFGRMYLFGYSLDNLSLMALTLCVGFVVDDAIVMLENITRHMERGQPRMQATLGTYRTSLAWVMRHRRPTMIAFGAIFVATGFLFAYMPKGFLPSDDVGQLFIITEAAQDISFDAMANLQQQVANVVRQNPHIENAMSFVGIGGPSPTLNAGRIFVTLKPRKERPRADQVVRELRPALAQFSDIRAFVQNVPAIRIGGQLTKSLYQYTLQGTDTTELYRVARDVEAKLRTLPGLVDVTS